MADLGPFESQKELQEMASEEGPQVVKQVQDPSDYFSIMIFFFAVIVAIVSLFIIKSKFFNLQN